MHERLNTFVCCFHSHQPGADADADAAAGLSSGKYGLGLSLSVSRTGRPIVHSRVLSPI